MFLLVVGFVLLASSKAYDLQKWDNDFDGPLNAECRLGWGLVGVTSTHRDNYEDRRFKFYCGCVSDPSYTQCHWTNYVNRYDERFNFDCSGHRYIAGVHSIHSNPHEDRIWRYKCCMESDFYLNGCHYTGWTSNWDQNENYHVPKGHVIKGVISEHDNNTKDRRFKYLVCKVGSHAEACQPRTGLLEFLLTNQQITK